MNLIPLPMTLFSLNDDYEKGGENTKYGFEERSLNMDSIFYIFCWENNLVYFWPRLCIGLGQFQMLLVISPDHFASGLVRL